MKPFQGCYYLGAHRAFSGVKNAFLVVHSVSGCAWGALALWQMGRQDDVRQGCTMVHENEVVFGGEAKLAEALEILKAHGTERAFVLNGCPTDMVRDDIQAVIDAADCPFPIAWMNTAGYCGSMRQGFMDAMCFLAGQMPRPESRFAEPSVNLVGLSPDDYLGEADAEAIRRMLEPEVRLNAVLPMLDEAGVRRFGRARLNLVFRGFEPVGEALKRALGMDYLVVDYPYGAAGSEAFLREVDAALDCDHRRTIAEGSECAAKYARQMVHPLRLIYQAEMAVAGDFMRADAMRRFLRDELGVRVSAYLDDLDPGADAEQWLENARDSGCVLAFGSTFQRQVEDEAPVRLLRFAYPVMDAVALGYRPYAGYDGLPNLLSDIFSGVMGVSYKRHGRFNP